MIVADSWLLDLALGTAQEKKVAQRVMRLQVLLANRTGHLLAISDEQVRRRICHAARYGSLARVYTRCHRCGWMAWLSCWEESALLTHETRILAIQRIYHDKHPEDSAYLRACPGEEVARAMYEAAGLPAFREG